MMPACPESRLLFQNSARFMATTMPKVNHGSSQHFGNPFGTQPLPSARSSAAMLLVNSQTIGPEAFALDGCNSLLGFFVRPGIRTEPPSTLRVEAVAWSVGRPLHCHTATLRHGECTSTSPQHSFVVDQRHHRIGLLLLLAHWLWCKQDPRCLVLQVGIRHDILGPGSVHARSSTPARESSLVYEEGSGSRCSQGCIEAVRRERKRGLDHRHHQAGTPQGRRRGCWCESDKLVGHLHQRASRSHLHSCSRSAVAELLRWLFREHLPDILLRAHRTGRFVPAHRNLVNAAAVLQLCGCLSGRRNSSPQGPDRWRNASHVLECDHCWLFCGP